MSHEGFKNKSKPCTIRFSTDFMVGIHAIMRENGIPVANTSDVVKTAMKGFQQAYDPNGLCSPTIEDYETVFSFMSIGKKVSMEMSNKMSLLNQARAANSMRPEGVRSILDPISRMSQEVSTWTLRQSSRIYATLWSHVTGDMNKVYLAEEKLQAGMHRIRTALNQQDARPYMVGILRQFAELRHHAGISLEELNDVQSKEQPVIQAKHKDVPTNFLPEQRDAVTGKETGKESILTQELSCDPDKQAPFTRDQELAALREMTKGKGENNER